MDIWRAAAALNVDWCSIKRLVINEGVVSVLNNQTSRNKAEEEVEEEVEEAQEEDRPVVKAFVKRHPRRK